MSSISSKSKTFATLTAIMAAAIPFIEILRNIIEDYGVNGYVIIHWLTWIGISVLFFIKKSKWGISIALSMLTFLSVYIITLNHMTYNLLYLLANMSLLAISILSIFYSKPIKYTFFIPCVLICIIETIIPGGFFRYTIEYIEYLDVFGLNLLFDFLITSLEICFYLFAGLFFASDIRQEEHSAHNRITANNSTVICQNCGTPNDANSTYCVACGNMVYNKKYCPMCGAENDKSNMFCKSCGNRFPE